MDASAGVGWIRRKETAGDWRLSALVSSLERDTDQLQQYVLRRTSGTAHRSYYSSMYVFFILSAY